MVVLGSVPLLGGRRSVKLCNYPLLPSGKWSFMTIWEEQAAGIRATIVAIVMRAALLVLAELDVIT